MKVAINALRQVVIARKSPTDYFQRYAFTPLPQDEQMFQRFSGVARDALNISLSTCRSKGGAWKRQAA